MVRAVPGPGTYELPAHLSVAVVKPDDPLHGKAAPGFMKHPYKSAPFQSRVVQQRSIISDHLGDPGAYTPRVLEDMAPKSRTSFNRPTTECGDGSFTTRDAARPHSTPARSQRRGPGEYDYQHIYACGRPVNGSVKIRSSFQSELPLGGHVRKSLTPGVGTYYPHASPDHVQARSMVKPFHSYSARGSSMFAGAGPRSRTSLSDELASRTAKSIGPGAYDLSPGSIQAKIAKSNKRLPGFGASAPRKSFVDYMC